MIENFHKLPLYSLKKSEKEQLLLEELNQLTEMHRIKCVEYAHYLEAIGYTQSQAETLEEIPFVPIRIFKELEMKSIPEKDVFKVMMSSGTSAQIQSKIYLNKENAILQQKVLLRILGDFVGSKRLPMLVVDSHATISDRRLFTTRGGTIMGLDFMAKKMIFALNDDMTLNVDNLEEFANTYGKHKFLIFGFTFMVWKYLFDEIEKKKLKIDFSNGYLLTAGGWKKLKNEAVSNKDFKKRGEKVCGIRHYIDHYGMAEQTGCIYAECECGHLHASIYSDIIVRRYRDFSPCEYGERGFIQLLSSLPHSYPGHSILTEDEGIILGEDDCPCGRKGKYIQILGRIKNAEIRGCSDTYATSF
ncbi:MAG: acyl-protein synthetase [Lachnospiraceae bacterium]